MTRLARLSPGKQQESGVTVEYEDRMIALRSNVTSEGSGECYEPSTTAPGKRTLVLSIDLSAGLRVRGWRITAR